MQAEAGSMENALVDDLFDLYVTSAYDDACSFEWGCMDATVIWDSEDDVDGNVQHIQEHDVTVEEAEDVLLDPNSSPCCQPHLGLAHGFWLDVDRPAPRGRLRIGGR